MQGVYYYLVKTQDEGQVETTEEKDKNEVEQNNNNDTGIILEEEPTPGINELRKSFLVATSKMRTMSNKDKSSRSEARLSR